MQDNTVVWFLFGNEAQSVASHIRYGKIEWALTLAHLAVSGQQKPLRHLLGLAYSDPSAASSGEEVD